MNFLAQIGELSGSTILFAYGPMGVFCAFFMWLSPKMLGEIRNLSHRIDGMTKAMLADLISRDNSGPHTQKFAREMLAKLEADDAKR